MTRERSSLARRANEWRACDRLVGRIVSKHASRAWHSCRSSGVEAASPYRHMH